jgi:hypothetical protein
MAPLDGGAADTGAAESKPPSEILGKAARILSEPIPSPLDPDDTLIAVIEPGCRAGLGIGSNASLAFEAF